MPPRKKVTKGDNTTIKKRKAVDYEEENRESRKYTRESQLRVQENLDNERLELLIAVWKSTAEKNLADSKQKAVKNKMGGIPLD